MTIYFFGLIVPFLSFFLQVWPRFINRYFGIDTWRHLMYADYVRRHKKLPKAIEDKYVVSAPFDYPPVIILLLSLFSKRFADKYQFLFSPLIDFINNLIVFLIAFILTQNLIVSILAQIIAALTPIIVIEASNLSTRILSHLVFLCSFVPLILFSISGNLWWLLIAYVFLLLLLFTHKMAVQAYIALIIGFTLVERNPLYLLFFLVTFFSAYILFGDAYRIIFRGHLIILNYWRKNIGFRLAHQIRGIPKTGKAYDFIQRMYLLAIKNPLAYMLGNNPWIAFYIAVGILILIKYLPSNPMLTQAFMGKFHTWIISLLVTSFVVLAIKKLRFLGEGNRYIEYCTLPISLVIGIYGFFFYEKYNGIFMLMFGFVCFCILGMVIFLQKKTIVGDTLRSIPSELWDIIHYLNEHEGKKVRFVVFPNSLGDALMYFLKGKILLSDTIVGMDKINDVFPVVTKPLQQIVAKYRLNYIIFAKRYVKLYELNLRRYKIVKDNKHYTLLKVFAQ